MLATKHSKQVHLNGDNGDQTTRIRHTLAGPNSHLDLLLVRLGRLKYLTQVDAPEIIVCNEMRLVASAMRTLIENENFKPSPLREIVPERQRPSSNDLRRMVMNMRSVTKAVCAAIAIATAAPALAQDVVETVTPNFEQAIPNIPGKSLVALVVDYPPGAASVPHTHAKSAFIYAYVISGDIESKMTAPPGSTGRARAGSNHPTPAIPSAAMRARPNRQSCSQSSSSTPTKRN